MLPRLLAFSMFFLSSFFCAGTASCDENRRPTEFEVKAAYIYNFVKFIQWPKTRSQEGSETIHVCVVGDDPFGSSLAAIEGKTAGDRKIGIKRTASLQNIRGCEIVFISNSEEGRVAQIMKAVNSSHVLTVGDTEGFAEQGVIINFYMENRTVRFEINSKAALRAGLRISSNLLRIARIVKE